MFYWELGADIIEKQKSSTWGEGFLKTLSKDLMSEFPEMKGFSQTNLKLIRQWYQFYSNDISISQQAVDQLRESSLSPIFNIPWGHNIAIISKCKNLDEALFYVNSTVKHNWSRNV
ncbi:hypothetical protein GLO73106DRAFT_00041190 [Gloeocapsa sp. PCC 73106]|nr:hypothetical protein GLO73106DRAFT_00041190 [Gloeocapsa sp. PCC 73106]